MVGEGVTADTEVSDFRLFWFLNCKRKKKKKVISVISKESEELSQLI